MIEEEVPQGTIKKVRDYYQPDRQYLFVSV